MSPSILRAFAAIVCAGALCIGPAAHAGGGEEGGGDSATEGPSYFGFVWDTRGATIAGAKVQLRAKNGKSAEFTTNVLGLYRGHIALDVKPDDVSMTCEKPGYKFSRFQRRSHAGTSPTNVEFDCILQRS